MSPLSTEDPQVTLDLGDRQVTLLGTAHVSRASAEQVRQLLNSGAYDAVAVELCASRHRQIADPDSLSRMDLFEVIRKGQVPMITATLALGAYQQRLAEQFGIEPGAEMRAAIGQAKAHGLPLELIDREIGTTLRRVYRSVPWWQRFYLFAGLAASLLTHEKITEAEIEQLKQGDLLESTFAQFATQAQALYLPLIEERDQYMAARLRQILRERPYRHVLAVVGAGHLLGIERHLQAPAPDAPALLERLDELPRPALWPKLLPWAIVLLILSGFALGFSQSSALGWRLVGDWILINGGLSALGAAIAFAHPVTILTAFCAAPLTSLNPTIGAGMVTAAVETYLRRPTVADFNGLRQAATTMKGWWHNRVTRILLVFILSTLGSIVGTYAAGLRIIDHLGGLFG